LLPKRVLATGVAIVAGVAKKVNSVLPGGKNEKPKG
jgi:hypothetical protein